MAQRDPASVSYDRGMSEPTIVEVVSIETLPLGANGSRRAIVRWSDGEVGEALRWYTTRSCSARAIMGTWGLCLPGVESRRK